MRLHVLILSCSVCLALCDAQEQNPSNTVADLYRNVVALHPLGIPRGKALRSLKPYISERMLHKLSDVKACEINYYQQHRRGSEKPPFVWLESGLFSGDNELALPSSVSVQKSELIAERVFAVQVLLDYVNDDGKEKSRYSWKVSVNVIYQRGKYVVDDVVFYDENSTDKRGDFYDLFSSCNGRQWNGK